MRLPIFPFKNVVLLKSIKNGKLFRKFTLFTIKYSFYHSNNFVFTQITVLNRNDKYWIGNLLVFFKNSLLPLWSCHTIFNLGYISFIQMAIK